MNKSVLLLKIRKYHYLISILTVSIVALLCAPIAKTENYHIVPYIFLFVVSILATFMSIAPLLLASTLSALVWNFFFIPPYYTFHIDKPEDILLFAMFFMIAMLNGVLTSRLRQQEELARERERHSNALFDLTSKLAKANGINELKEIAVRSISKEFGVNSVIKLNYDTSEPYNISKNDTGRVFQLKGTRVNLGVAILDSSKEIEDNVFFTAYLSQITNALEREYLAELAQKARFLDESDRLYKTLFNSISHELRIPVATIMGAAESLLSLKHSESVRTELSNEIFTASARLNRVIENLLNMSRLESGRISVRLDWHDMNDLINKVIADLEFELRNLIVTVEMSEDLPLVRIDFGLMEQVLYNLLFNSSEHSPAGSEIIIKITSKNEMFEIVIMDQGPGFPEDKISNVFDKFFRIESSKSGGLGLGLSIVKGFVEAHKGTITVENRVGGGALFTILIPSKHPEMTNLKS